VTPKNTSFSAYVSGQNYRLRTNSLPTLSAQTPCTQSRAVTKIAASAAEHLWPHHLVSIVDVSAIRQQQATDGCLSSPGGVCQWAATILQRHDKYSTRSVLKVHPLDMI